jgi:xylulokinase
MDNFLGIDLGASALKACLIDGTGRTLISARAAYETDRPQPGHSEQNPADWRSAMHTALADLRARNDAALDNVQAISFSGGAHIAVLCDNAGIPLRPAIMWNDQRAHKEAAQLAAQGTAEQLAGNTPNATWTLPQLIWLANHEPHIIKATEKLYFAKDWLAAQLIDASADNHVSDISEAAGSLMAGRNHDWHDTLIALSGVSPTAMPRLVSMGSKIGKVSDKAAVAFGLPQVPVYQGAIDTSMEWLCTAPVEPDSATVKLASAGVISFATAQDTRFPPVSYYPHIIDGLFYHAAGMSDCMGALEFVRQEFTPSLTAQEFEHAAASTAIGADGVLFYPYLSGARAPFWDATLTAEMRGLTRAHTVNHAARAAYEGVGHVVTAIWHDMVEKLRQRPASLHVLGGGGQSNFFCQMLADMLNVEIKRGGETDCAFATALFAAAAHQQKHAAEIALRAYRSHDVFTPDKKAHAVYASLQKSFMARHLPA